MPGKMRIALLYPADTIARDYFEQFVFPNGHRTESCEFVINPREGRFDGIVVPQSMRPLDTQFELVCPPTRTLCAILEPPDILTLPDEYTKQFYAVVGPDVRVACRQRLLSAAGHHWFVELTAEHAILAPIVNKTRVLSAVVSSKQHTRGHRDRYALMNRLKEHFGETIDWFGRGVRETGTSKLVALADYKYHIVLENGRWPHYWTEKLSDAFMANCYPFYSGAPNVDAYFDPKSLTPIDPTRPRDAIRAIEAAINMGLWEERQEYLASARSKIVGDYHPYMLWSSILTRLPKSAAAPVIIRPFNECKFGIKQRLQLARRNAQARLFAS